MSLEIGSDFHTITEGKKEWHLPDNRTETMAFFFSGRTAIQCVIKAAEAGDHIKKKVLLPDYCCFSMMEPFQKSGYEIDFYQVTLQDQEISLPDLPPYGIVFLCHYFGYRTMYPWQKLQEFRDAGGIVVEDITHSLLSEHPLFGVSDYSIASIRKWDGFICGGIGIADGNRLNEFALKPPSEGFIDMRTRAMQLKSEYLKDGSKEKKEEFRNLFVLGEDWLDEHYDETAMDAFSKEKFLCWDVDRIRKIRIENATYLYENLSDIKGISFAFSVDRMEIPLFVPILLEKNNRDALRRILTQNEIYCPIHWPRPKECDNVLYDQELSLVCDQRYTQEDMERVVTVVKEFARQCL